jgi:phosphoglycerate dehydrogenase-like enzyme
MNLAVHYFRALDREIAGQLRAELAPNVQLGLGTSLPENPDYQILIAGRPDREWLTASPRLKALVIPWSGLPEPTVELLLGFPHIAVHNLHYNARPVAEHALALAMAAAKGLILPDAALRRNDWSPRYEPARSLMLEGRTALILGFGAIGRRVAELCQGLGMEILAIRRRLGAQDSTRAVPTSPLDALPSLLPQADLLFVCLPLTEETEGMIGAEELALLPPRAILVNIGRGKVVDQKALYLALRDGGLHSAGVDVWYQYPEDKADRLDTPPSAYPFHELDNIVMSPHRAGHIVEKESIRLRQLAAMLNTAARGEPLPNRVDLQAGY